MKNRKKSSGNCDCTPSPEPVRSASHSPSDPKPAARAQREQEDQRGTAGDACVDVHARRERHAQIETAWTPPSADGAADLADE